jgi:hypothetical protein
LSPANTALFQGKNPHPGAKFINTDESALCKGGLMLLEHIDDEWTNGYGENVLRADLNNAGTSGA